jgi:hypothetical protein
MTSERKLVIQDNIKGKVSFSLFSQITVVVPLGAHFVYSQEIKKKDLAFANSEEVYKLFKENLNALQECIDTLTKQQEVEMEVMSVEMIEKKRFEIWRETN